ncbi:Amine sulfotransferase [Holothuria leucospilota]|uniref:Amine sulfotransferase n=1 Tax=Holothuria leucospilota TaxID=206669 RepID=A0A9Q0YJV3_HOLLE|nr:Amine sulfotransferase [Holothuria leucospilota]
MAGDVFDFNSIIVHKDGFPLPYLTNEGFMKELENMELREDDIFVVTYPKSGTHWMQEIVQLILVNGHGEKLNNSHRRMRIELADVKSKSPEVIEAAGPTLRHMKEDPSPRVFTTHVPYSLLPKKFREKSCKLIYVYRHPKDVIVSFFNYLSQRHDIHGVGSVKKTHSSKQFASFFDIITSGKCMCFVPLQLQYGSWFDHVIGYYKHREDENMFSVSYEKMKKKSQTGVHYTVRK